MEDIFLSFLFSLSLSLSFSFLFEGRPTEQPLSVFHWLSFLNDPCTCLACVKINVCKCKIAAFIHTFMGWGVMLGVFFDSVPSSAVSSFPRKAEQG